MRRFEYVPDNGFGTSLYLRIGWFWLTWTKFENHWYLQFMWAEPRY